MTTEEQKAWDEFAKIVLKVILDKGCYNEGAPLEIAKIADAMMEQRKARMG